MTCNNCKTTLSCGCQVRTASNGARVCSHCITAYEAGLSKLKVATAQNLSKQNN